MNLTFQGTILVKWASLLAPSCLPCSVRLDRLPSIRTGGIPPGRALWPLLPNFLPSLGTGWEKQYKLLAEAAGVLLIN